MMRDEKRIIQRYKRRLVKCWNKEGKSEAKTLSPMSDFVTIWLILCLTKRPEYHAKRLKFQNAFLLGNLNQILYAELPRHLYPGEMRRAI